MKCMKCGKDTVLDQVFCPECQKEMARYPVNPNTPVILPKPNHASPIKKPPRKKVIPPEEQIAALKKRIRTLTILLVLVFCLGAGLLYGTVRYYQKNHFQKGQNYTSIISKFSTVSTAGDK